MSREIKKKLFHDWAYGLFIHYGVYSVYGQGEWKMFKERLKPEEYFREALPHFHPTYQMGHDWASFARRVGMRYGVLTTRHHEGYFIGDDVIRGFVDGCRKNGLGIGLYYSVADWSDPDYCAGPNVKDGRWERFVQKTHRQIKQIMTDYGQIDYLFYDGCPVPESWRMQKLHKEIRAMQPGMLISRCMEDTDLMSCERHTGGDPNAIWETCDSLNGAWSYNSQDADWKSPKSIIRLLSTNRHNGGNLLLSIGPKADGTIQPEVYEILDKVGSWVHANEEALFDVEPHPFQYCDREISTSKGNNAYFILEHIHGPDKRIAGIGSKVKRVTELVSGKDIRFEQFDDIIILHGMPRHAPEDLPLTIKFELVGRPFGIKNPMQPERFVKFEGE